jgi:hypothetical protein
MKYINHILNFLVVLMLLGINLQAQDVSLENAVVEMLPNVVMITAIDSTTNRPTIAAGFVVQDFGYVITNYHVICQCDKVTVKFNDGTEYKTNMLVDFDPQIDFAILSIDDPENKLPDGIPLGNSNSVKLAQDVYTIGNPFGLEYTVSDGIISKIHKVYGDTLFQITVPISPGSSGGPLLTKDGEVIGVVLASFTFGQNLNLALPSNYIKERLNKKKRDFTTLAEIKKLEKREGLQRKIDKYNCELKIEPHMYKVYVPKDWIRNRTIDIDDKLAAPYVVETFTPKRAYRRDLKGCLSEGIRIYVRSAPASKPWTKDALVKWTNESAMNILTHYDGLSHLYNVHMDVYGNPGRLFCFVGGTRGVIEHEERKFIFTGNTRNLVAIEIVSPRSRLEDYHELFETIIHTFALLE